MKPEKVAIYARVSTVDKGQDVNLQLCDLRTYADGEDGRYSKSISM